ncbi:MAG: precorrin-2 C(20)-methyltransferase [Eubacterium sp.]|jgi:precorrin-2/cobalt-factor-2 C20-methyltransferase|nr:precorrin-2 C(20)-methyltransferase [Eubacterium sp.]
MVKGKLFGIGVGPGDPELLTLKAIKVMRKCEVIALPSVDNKEKTAFSVVKDHLNGKKLIECRFSMENDIEKRKKSRIISADTIISLLEGGKNVGFITLGDPTVYSTYMYLHKIIVSNGFIAEIIPGVTSFTAAAASLGISLCEGDETLLIIPSGNGESNDKLLDYPGNKVIMKSGENLTHILEKLKKRGYGNRTKVAFCVGMDDQQLYYDINDYERIAKGGYFNVVIVK